MMRQFFAVMIAGSALAAEPATFHRDVLPVLRGKCVACHNADGLGPFPLDNFTDVRKRAGQITRIIADGLMPPWKPEGGHFAWDRRLSAVEAATFRHWVEAGAQEGEAGPPPQANPDGWMLGEPDMILTAAQAFAIPAEGRDLFVHYVFPLGLGEERQLRAVEVLPGNRRVTHGALGILDRSGSARERAGKDGRYELYGGPGFVPTGYTPGYFPGQAARAFGDSAITLTADTDFVLQVHYRPRGEAMTDVPRVGLYFAKEPVVREVSGVFLGCEDIRIPAGAGEARLRDTVTLPVALRATDIRARMLRVGVGVRVWAELPGGKKIPLLKISDWEREWEETWRFAEAAELPKGTRIYAEWIYDNSSANPRNPNKPPREIRAGETEADEAAVVWIGGSVAGWIDRVTLNGANLTHYIDLATAAHRRK